MRAMRPVVVLAYATAATALAAQWIAAKIALAVAPPLELSTVRYAIAALVLLAVVAVTRSPLPLHRWRPVAAAAALGVVGFNVLAFLGLRLTPAADAAIIVPTTIPVATALLATLVGERLTRRKLAGFAVASTGSAIVIAGGQQLATGISADRLLGDLLLVGSAVAWAACLIVSTLVVRTTSIIGFVALLTLFGTAMLLPLGFLEHGYRDLASWPASTGVAALSLGVVSTVVAFVVYFWAVRSFGAGPAALLSYLAPVAGLVLALAVLGERPMPLQLAGALVTLVGVRLATRRPAAAGR